MQLQIYTFANHCNASVIILHFAPIYRSHDEKAESQHKWFEISFNCQKRNSAKKLLIQFSSFALGKCNKLIFFKVIFAFLLQFRLLFIV